MGRYWRRRRRTQWKGYPSEANRPPTKAQKFSTEVGGGDEDVKGYFLSLPSYELTALLQDYEQKYGIIKRQYAEKAYSDWKSGLRQMSVLVKTRLYEFLPKRMPLEKKYEVIRKLWQSTRPKPHSYHVFYVGKGANPAILKNRVLEHLGNVVQDHYFSEGLRAKFEWLAAGDVYVREQLQNYFEQLKTACVAEALKERLEIVASHLKNSPEDHTIQTVRLENHVVEIKWTNLADGTPDAPKVKKLQDKKREVEEAELEAQRQKEAKVEARNSAFGCLFMIVLVVALVKACGR